MGSNRQLLAIADSLETVFKNQEQDLAITHRMLAQEQQSKSEIQIALVRKDKKIGEVQAALVRKDKQIEEVQAALEEKARHIAQVQEELRLLFLKYQALEEWKRIDLARRFGASSERWTADEQTQAVLFNELETCLPPIEVIEEEAAPALPESTCTPTPRAEKNRGKRDHLPENLRREERIIDIPDSEKICTACGKEMVHHKDEISEQLHVKPMEFYVERTIRPSYICSCGCGGVRTAAVEPRVYPKSILGDSVLALITTSKYCDALPFYRQERILGRSGINISRQTMARSAQAVADWLSPLAQILHERLKQCPVLCADETRLRVLNEHGIKKDGQSYMWVACGEDDRGQIVKFHYGGGRGATVARELIGNFTGVLMCDGYGAYPAAVSNAPITLGACMAHVRRQFHDVLKGDSCNPRAKEAMGFIGQLYGVEKEVADHPAESRLRLRQEKALPLFQKFRSWLYTQSSEVAPAGALGKAVKYAVSLIERMEVYLHNGNVPIDNNQAENAIRPFVVGRKNWLFSAEVDGANASATLYSIIETAKANYLEPMHYLHFLFACHRKYGDAMPWADLAPRPDLRDYAEKIGVPWEFV